MDPVTQTLAQQTSGSAEGQGFGQFYLQGRQLGQEDKRINLARQRLELEGRQEARMQKHDNLIDPLHADLLGAQAAQMGAHAVATKNANELEAMRMAFIPELQDLEMDFLASPLGGSDPELRSRARQIFDQNPAAKYNQAGQGVMQIIKGAAANAAEFRQVDEAYARYGNRLRGFDPKTGHATFADEQDLALKRERLQQARTRLQQQADDMLRKKDAQGLSRVRFQLEALKTQEDALEKGYSIENMPGLPTELYNPAPAPVPATSGLPPTQGELAPATNAPATTPATNAAPTLTRIPRPTTSAATTKLQEDVIGADVAIRQLDRLESLVNTHPEAFGARGLLGEAIEVGTGLIDPSSSAEVTNVRNEAGIGFYNLAKGLKLDSQMSNYERFQLERVGDITGWRDKPEAAKGKVQNLRNALIASQLRKLKALNTVPPDPLLRRIPVGEVQGVYDDNLIADTDLIRLVNGGRLTPEQAQEIYNNKPKG